MASSTAFSSRRSSSLLEEVLFAVFGFPDVTGSACESVDRLSGLFTDCGMTDDETTSFAGFASETGDGSRGRFLAACSFSLVLLASVLAGCECWDCGLNGSLLSVLATDCN